LCAGSVQPPDSRQWALHMRRLQSLRIRVELHPIVRQDAFRGAANCIGKRFCAACAPEKEGTGGAGPSDWVVAGNCQLEWFVKVEMEAVRELELGIQHQKLHFAFV
jgi:hypothetical protein